jgi:Fe2+ transport system protein FeoA
MNEGNKTTLADLKPGESGIVLTVGGTDALHRRLLDMGLTPGVKVFLQKTAPMGDPLEIHLRGYALTLRVMDAGNISIRRTETNGKGDDRA